MFNQLCFIALLMSLLMLPAVADENPYLAQVRQYEPDDKTQQESKEKLQNPAPQPLKDPLSVPPFHKASNSYTGSAGSLCGECHVNLPHRTDENKRSFLNFHTTFIACETCHWQPDNIKLTYNTIKFTDIAKTKTDSTDDTDAKKSLIQAGYRIAPFYKKSAVTIMSNHPFTQKISKRWENGNEEEKITLRAQLHKPLVTESIKCTACHQENNSLLDLNLLKATPEQQHAYAYNPIAIYTDKLSTNKDTKPIHLIDLLE